MDWKDETIENAAPEELVRMQLEEWKAQDVALASTFRPEKIVECWEWIVKKAQEKLGNSSGAVWHGTVFRWARDYFVDGHANDAAPASKTKRKAAPRDADSPEALAMDAVAVPAEAPAASKPEAAPVPGIQLDLFAEAR